MNKFSVLKYHFLLVLCCLLITLGIFLSFPKKTVFAFPCENDCRSTGGTTHHWTCSDTCDSDCDTDCEGGNNWGCIRKSPVPSGCTGDSPASGVVNSADCDEITGSADDPNDDRKFEIKLYRDGDKDSGTLVREISNVEGSFTLTTDNLADDARHDFYAYMVDPDGNYGLLKKEGDDSFSLYCKRGELESANCNSIRGWADEPDDDPDEQVRVEIFKDVSDLRNPEPENFIVAVSASLILSPSNNHDNHSFQINTGSYLNLADYDQHDVYVYMVIDPNGTGAVLNNSENRSGKKYLLLKTPQGANSLSIRECYLTSYCGDRYCGIDETCGSTNYCERDCGECVGNTTATCAKIETDEVSVNVSKGAPNVTYEPEGGMVPKLSRQVQDSLVAGYIEAWKKLRYPDQSSEDPDQKFNPTSSEIVVEGKLKVDGGEPVPGTQKFNVPDTFFGTYNLVTKAVKEFLTPPEIQSPVDQTNVQNVTDAPKDNFTSRGKVVLPWGPSLLQIAQAAWDKLIGTFGRRSVVPQVTQFSTCTPDAITTLQNERESTLITKLPNMPSDRNQIKHDFFSWPMDVYTSVGGKTPKTVQGATFGTGSLRKDFVNTKQSLTFIPEFLSTDFNLIAETSAIPRAGTTITPSLPIPNTTIGPVLNNINQLLNIYRDAARMYNIPWQMLAAVHYREGTSNPNQAVYNGHPICSIDADRSPPPNARGTYHHCLDGNTLENDAKDAARHLVSKVNWLISLWKITDPLRFDPADNNEESIKWAFYGYNGIGYGQDTYTNSPYVMNNWERSGMQWRGTLPDGSWGSGTDTRDGAWKVYVLLVRANYDNGDPATGTIVSLNTSE